MGEISLNENSGTGFQVGGYGDGGVINEAHCERVAEESCAWAMLTEGSVALALALKSTSLGNCIKLFLLNLMAKLTGLQTSHMLIKKLIKTHQF